MVLRVVLADDNFLVRQGTAALLAEAADVDVIALAEDGPSLVQTVRATAPDVVLTDIRMPPTYTDEGLRAAKQIRRDHPGTGVVVLSQYAEPADVMDLLSGGVAGLGYLLKERIARLDELVAALHAVRRGGSALDPHVVEALVIRRRDQDRSPLAALSERELAVLREMATGKSNAAIARALYVSERAVEKHTNALFAKLGVTEEPDVNRRVLAVLRFLEAPPPD
ncbi:two component transcriptional regulator, LuxR family [Geodermatophilus amargosae]|uniref:Two component transcriptional regulator, LuxR family n=1 Tax=Geodermatophilus amargosae TaxID=1296565 RepID=A0A1I7DBH7_9ACTN|nr:response regulator transcription factor [Geodermatophilus amargosae]SFU08956.1 two component transcriptional regulator, LuxR family [Geodermatophilus amargosae]